MSKNIAQGNFAEKCASLNYHSQHRAILISSKLLRSYSLGQIDLSYIKKGRVHLFEVKASQTGIGYMSRQQKLRINRSADFIARILDVEVQINYLNGCQMRGHSLTL